MSDFASKGFDHVPSLHIDNRNTERMALLPDKAIADKVAEYNAYLERDILPHHREQALRYLAHLTFEQWYRDGTSTT